MLLAGHRYGRSKRRLEHLEFAATESLARSGCAADRAMMLDEQEVVGVADDLGKIALGSSALSECAHSHGNRPRGKGCLVRRELLRGAVCDDLIERAVAKRRSNRIDELYRELAMAVREKFSRQRSRAPMNRRSAATVNGTFETFDQTGLLKSVKVLANGGSGGVEPFGEVMRGCIVGALERLDNSSLCIGEFRHRQKSNLFSKR